MFFLDIIAAERNKISITCAFVLSVNLAGVTIVRPRDLRFPHPQGDPSSSSSSSSSISIHGHRLLGPTTFGAYFSYYKARRYIDFASTMPCAIRLGGIWDNPSTFRAWRARNEGVDLPHSEDVVNNYDEHVRIRDRAVRRRREKRWPKEAPQSGT
jgi:hypothetical protein